MTIALYGDIFRFGRKRICYFTKISFSSSQPFLAPFFYNQAMTFDYTPLEKSNCIADGFASSLNYLKQLTLLIMRYKEVLTRKCHVYTPKKQ
jgi:hypothetical protein